MRVYFSEDLGKQHVLSCTDLVVLGKAKLHTILLRDCQVKTQDPRYITFLQFSLFATGLILLSRSSDVFYIDASTKETISADLTKLLLPKASASRRQPRLIGFLGSARSGCFYSDNADDATLDLRFTLSPLLSHGNILITSRNRDICVYRFTILARFRHENNDKRYTNEK